MSDTALVVQQEPADYFAAPGLSNSGMKDLAVSPMRYWHLHLNPQRPVDEPTPAMRFGSALHCAVLEPREFGKRYAKAFDQSEHEGCLVTMDDLRAWCISHNLPSSAKSKDELIKRVATADPDAPISDVLRAQHAIENAGKVILSPADWGRVHSAAASVWMEPRIQALLAEGQPEVPMFATDPETGVLLKARMDWVAPRRTVDLKTFAQQRGKSIDKSINDAIWYEHYHWQAYLYTLIRTLQPGAAKGEGPTARASAAPPFVLIFVESEEPHEVRIRELRPMSGGRINMFWERSRIEVRNLIQAYAECMAHFGPDKPWRYAQEVNPLEDEDLPALAWS